MLLEGDLSFFMDSKRLFMVGVNVGNPIFEFGTFRNTYWQFKHLLSYLLSAKSEFLQTYLLSDHLVLEGGMLIFMDSNRFFMVGVTFIRLL